MNSNHSRLVLTALALAVVGLGACRSDPPPPPAPTGPSPEEIARRQADSLARVRAREDSIARARAEEQMEEEEATTERFDASEVAAARETLQELVFFDYDESTLTPEAELKLRAKVEILRASPAVRLLVEGHADERGSTEYNLALANRRADTVREFLVGFGLDPNRFSIVSYGEEQPLVNASTEAAWARNRRAEFVITAGENEINPAISR